MNNSPQLVELRKLITESIRIQRDTQNRVDYIDSGNVLTDVGSRQNHVIFGRRGCGKSLLLHATATKLPADIKRVYLNCEDYKQHSFPNVLIEILESVFRELESNLPGWFGRKRKQKMLISDIRKQLAHLKESPDIIEEQIQKSEQVSRESSNTTGLNASFGGEGAAASASLGRSNIGKQELSETSKFVRHTDKLAQLNNDLPSIKHQLREFFEISNRVQAVFLQIDDFYHLRLTDQPFVIDYVHRLCKDLPMYFKVATLRHSSSLFIERDRQPVGVQERHDYLPIDIDFSFEQFQRTRDQVRKIFHEYAQRVGIRNADFDSLFKGEGFTRLVVTGGGVPRDCLSIFLEALASAQETDDPRIGKDTMRLLSMQTFESRIQDLKKDSQANEQDTLLGGIYAIREFCFDNKTNAFVIEERELRDVPAVNQIVFRLLDYRIIHAAASAFTHKTHKGSYRAYVIDVGCYGFLRKLEGKINEIDVSETGAKEKLRSAPHLTAEALGALRRKAPKPEQWITLLREAARGLATV